MAEKKIPYGEGWILPDKKQYWFMKRSAADIDISDDKGGDFFTYTPGFGEFKESSGIEGEYLEWNPETQEFDEREDEEDEEDE